MAGITPSAGGTGVDLSGYDTGEDAHDQLAGGSGLDESEAAATSAGSGVPPSPDETADAGVWPRLVSLDRPALPEFPIDALPRDLARFAEAVAEATQTPLALPALNILGVVSAALAGRVEVATGEEWSEPACCGSRPSWSRARASHRRSPPSPGRFETTSASCRRRGARTSRGHRPTVG